MVAAKRDNIQAYYSAKAGYTPRIYYRGWIISHFEQFNDEYIVRYGEFHLRVHLELTLVTQNALQ